MVHDKTSWVLNSKLDRESRDPKNFDIRFANY